MKRILAPIEVETQKGWPTRLTWEGRRLTVERPISYWVRESRWWMGRSEQRVYFRLQTDRGIVEIYRRQAGSDHHAEWVLVRMID